MPRKGGADDEAKQLEVAQRLPHGTLAHAELLRDFRFDDPGAGRKAAVENVLDQLFADLLAEDAAFERSGLGVLVHECDVLR